MNRYPRYPAYKPSGVKWLGEIPAHWEAPRVKFVAPIQNERSEEKSEKLPYVPLEFIESGSGRLIEVGTTAKVESVVSLFRANDVLFNKLRPYLAKVVLAPFDGSCTSELLVLRPIPKLVPKFSFYYLLSDPIIKVVDSFTYGAKMPRANSTQIADLPLVVPPPEEQTAIVAFLDEQTAVLDSLIQEKQALIQLLQEKRAAVIGQAVTQGLDSTVPMKESEVEWIGRIPAHWESGRAKFYCKTTKGFAFKADFFVDEGIPVVKATDIKNETIIPGKSFVEEDLAKNFEKVTLREGDIILSTVGSKAHVVESAVGQVAIVPNEFSGALLNQNTVCLEIQEIGMIRPAYFFAVLRSHSFRKYLDLHAHGTANQASLNLSDILDFTIPFPKSDEQERIVEYIGIETAKIDELITETEASIATLQEYRTAFIAAAVTGQIDVR